MFTAERNSDDHWLRFKFHMFAHDTYMSLTAKFAEHRTMLMPTIRNFSVHKNRLNANDTQIDTYEWPNFGQIDLVHSIWD